MPFAATWHNWRLDRDYAVSIARAQQREATDEDYNNIAMIERMRHLME
jgi:hypothetical protein